MNIRYLYLTFWEMFVICTQWLGMLNAYLSYSYDTWMREGWTEMFSLIFPVHAVLPPRAARAVVSGFIQMIDLIFLSLHSIDKQIH